MIEITMASSQVELASAPFGCVLRDHNRRDRCRDSNARATMGVFGKNLKSLVRDHLCIAVNPNPGSDNNNANSENQIHDNANGWDRNNPTHKDENNNSNSNGSGAVMSPRHHARVLDRWAFARQIVLKPIERQSSQEAEVLSVPNSAPSSSRTSTSPKEETMPRTDSLADLSKKGVGASSLVQIWEKRLNKSDSHKINSNLNVATEMRRTNSLGICVENDNVFSPINASPSRASETDKAESPVCSAEKTGESLFFIEKPRESIDERFDAGPVTEDSFEGSDGIDSRKLDATEKEKVRVADIIRRLSAHCPSSSVTTEDNCNDHDRQFSSAHGSPCREFSREGSRERCSGSDQVEHRGSQVISSLWIRGRQAFADLLMQLERDRHRELDTLVERKTVSRFPQRGRTRIQSSLRLRLLQHRVAFAGVDVPQPPPKASRLNKKTQGSSIMYLREKFNTGFEQGSLVQSDAVTPRSPDRKVVKNIRLIAETSSTSSKPNANTPNREVNIIEQQYRTSELRANEDLHEEVSSSSEVTIEEISATARLNSPPHVHEDLHQETNQSLKVAQQEKCAVDRNHDSQETEDTATPMDSLIKDVRESNENRNHDSQETEDTATPMDSLIKDVRESNENRNHDSQETEDTATPMDSLIKDDRESNENRKLVCSSNGPNGEEKCKVLSIDTTTLSSEDGNEMCKGTSSDARNLETPETTGSAPSLNVWNESAVCRETSLESRDFEAQETADTTSLVDWDDNEDYYQYYGETNNDWISEISRPLSYWEDIRKSWYKEMLNSNSEKGEIHQLLERKTVSNFLSSDFRDKIDRLMVSRIERKTCPRVSQEEDDESFDRMNQMVSFFQHRRSPSGIEEEEAEQVQEQMQEQVQVPEQVQVQEQGRGHQDLEVEEMTEEEEEPEQEDEEEKSLISGQFQEASDYFDNASLQPSPHFTTWSYQDNEVGDESDRGTSASPRQQSPFRSYYPNSPQRSPSQSYNANDRQQSPSLSHPSMEMELIYDLKGHMMQLYQEMSELRKAIKSCVDVQMSFQQSMKQEVHSGQVGKKRNSSGLTKKGNCCICNEAKIDSLLYRCGHMCTCIKCAHELQWNSGKCPICQAPIADVVRAYMVS